MAADIIQPTQFRGPQAPTDLTEQMRSTLPQARVVGPHAFDELTLPEPQYGEEIVGELSPEETDLFVALFHANAEVKRLEREIGGGLMVELGTRYKSGNDDMFEVDDPNKLVDHDAARSYFRAQAEAAAFRFSLYWQLGERFNAHDWSLGIRTKRRVVKVKRKW